MLGKEHYERAGVEGLKSRVKKPRSNSRKNVKKIFEKGYSTAMKRSRCVGNFGLNCNKRNELGESSGLFRGRNFQSVGVFCRLKDRRRNRQDSGSPTFKGKCTVARKNCQTNFLTREKATESSSNGFR